MLLPTGHTLQFKSKLSWGDLRLLGLYQDDEALPLVELWVCTPGGYSPKGQWMPFETLEDCQTFWQQLDPDGREWWRDYVDVQFPQVGAVEVLCGR